MPLGTNVLWYPIPTLSSACIRLVSGSNWVKSLVILAVFSQYTDTISYINGRPEEHRFQAAGNERKKERILVERMKERKQEKEKERKKRERKKNPGKLPGRSTTSSI
jgi:hypothetical protein